MDKTRLQLNRLEEMREQIKALKTQLEGQQRYVKHLEEICLDVEAYIYNDRPDPAEEKQYVEYINHLNTYGFAPKSTEIVTDNTGTYRIDKTIRKVETLQDRQNFNKQKADK